MNPLFKREFFARWRDWRSHALLLLLALGLSGAAYLAYQNALDYQPSTYQMTVMVPGTGVWTNRTSYKINGRTVWAPAGQWTGQWKTITYMTDPRTGRSVPYQPESAVTRTARAGRNLFECLALGNAAVWFLLAPLLTATGVARERERGLLEGLQLSPMSPVAQIGARASSALAFVGVLQLVTLPIYWIAYSFGGVAPTEIRAVWAIVLASALGGVGLGLMLSAQSARPSSALFGALTVLFVWSLLAGAGFYLSMAPLSWGFGPWTNAFFQACLFSHPVALVWQILEFRSSIALTFISPLSGATWGAFALWPWASLSWCVLGTLALGKARRDVTRTLPPPPPTFMERWRARHEKRKRAALTRPARRVEGALLWELPLDKWIRFQNPLLNREVKSRFRWRTTSVWVSLGRTSVFLLGVVAWSLAMFSTFLDPPSRAGAVPGVLWTVWGLGVMVVATFAAASYAREREAGTWEGLAMSLLRPAGIARTKWASPLIAFAAWSSPLWLLLPFLAPWGRFSGVPFGRIALGFAVVAASLCFVSALGCWISLRARSSTHALCWTLGVLLVGLWLVPPFVQGWGIASSLTLWRYGVPAKAGDNLSPYILDSPELRDQYQRATGHAWPASSSPSVSAKWPWWDDYLAWIEQRRVEAEGFQSLLFAWSPTTVLSQLNAHLSSDGDEPIMAIALWHIALCYAGTLGLLGLITRSLDGAKRRRAPSPSTPVRPAPPATEGVLMSS